RARQRGQYTTQDAGSVRVDGEVLARDEVNITLEPLENRAVAQDLQWQGGLAVALDRAITPELRAEGLAREIVHRVQTMRRDAGLSVEDHIVLGYDTATSILRSVFAEHGGRIGEDVGAIQLVPSSELRVAGQAADQARVSW